MYYKKQILTNRSFRSIIKSHGKIYRGGGIAHYKNHSRLLQSVKAKFYKNPFGREMSITSCKGYGFSQEKHKGNRM